MSSHRVVSYRQVFRDVAYKAKNRADLVAGIEEFLDQVTVLPPGEWDPSIRIEPPKSVPSQVGAAEEGGARGTGRMAARLGMLLRGPDSQGPSLTQSHTQTSSKRSQRLKYVSGSYFPFNRKKGRCQELSMTVLLGARRRNTVVLNWSGQEGVSFNSLVFFFCLALKSEHAPPF